MARTFPEDATEARIDRWPGRATRAPDLGDYGYLPLRALARALRVALEHRFRGRRDLLVLDVGCDCKPYFPLFSPYARRYVGSDVGRVRPQVDVVAGASSIPFVDGCADAVLCSQVLEHVPDPAAALREMARVLKPGGCLFLSTHGTFIYHPHPTDYWRWTQDGLAKLFADVGRFDAVELHPNGSTGHCLAYLLAVYCYLTLKKKWLRPVRRLLVPLVNVAGLGLGRLLRRFDYPAPHSLIANFLVVARRRGGPA